MNIVFSNTAHALSTIYSCWDIQKLPDWPSRLSVASLVFFSKEQPVCSFQKVARYVITLLKTLHGLTVTHRIKYRSSALLAKTYTKISPLSGPLLPIDLVFYHFLLFSFSYRKIGHLLESICCQIIIGSPVVRRKKALSIFYSQIFFHLLNARGKKSGTGLSFFPYQLIMFLWNMYPYPL